MLKEDFITKKIILKFSLCLFSLLLLTACGSATDENINKEISVSKEEESSEEQWKFFYKSFLKKLYEEKDANENLEFAIKDLDNNDIPELVIADDGISNISVYSFDEKIKKVGKCDFETGTTRLLFSNEKKYSGIFTYFASGGLDHYGYISVVDKKLVEEELWNEDYSGISKELGIERERIQELSQDKELIKESKVAYKKSQDMSFNAVHPDYFSELDTK